MIHLLERYLGMRKPTSTLLSLVGNRRRTTTRPMSMKRGESGAVAVEFALAFPILLSVFMVMMFLMDVMMVKQEVTNVGFTAMRECVNVQNKSECVLDMVNRAQHLPGSNPRYTCNAGASQPVPGAAATFQVVNLRCEYQGFLRLNSIFQLTGVDMTDMVEFDIPVFFTES